MLRIYPVELAAELETESRFWHNSTWLNMFTFHFFLPNPSIGSRRELVANSTHIAGPTVWNSLPDELRDPACGSDSFKQFLNTILFSLYWCDQRIGGFLKCYALYKSTFYLLNYLLTARRRRDSTRQLFTWDDTGPGGDCALWTLSITPLLRLCLLPFTSIILLVIFFKTERDSRAYTVSSQCLWGLTSL